MGMFAYSLKFDVSQDKVLDVGRSQVRKEDGGIVGSRTVVSLNNKMFQTWEEGEEKGNIGQRPIGESQAYSTVADTEDT